MKKVCRTCERELNITSFHFTKKSKDGHEHHCKDCRRTKSQAYYKKNAEKYHAYRRTDAYKKSTARAARAHREKHPERDSAWNAVTVAIRKGDLVSRPCACGEEETQAHHPDYSKPLEVMWVCRRCHHNIHMRERMAT